MLDFIGTVATAAMIVFLVATVVLVMDAPRSAKLTLAAIAGLWAGFCAAAGAAGWLAATKPFPIIGLFVAAPLLAAAIAAAFPAARHAMLAKAEWNVEELGLFGAPPLTVIASEESHATIFASLQMLGLGRTRVTRVAADEQGIFHGQKGQRPSSGAQCGTGRH